MTLVMPIILAIASFLHYSVAKPIENNYCASLFLRIMLTMKPNIILINPWIYDFAAFDLWSKPLGLLYIASYLKNLGFNVHLIDCLDVYHKDLEIGPNQSLPSRRKYGTGKYRRQRIPAPPPLGHIKRAYHRYGITTELFSREIEKIKEPSAILVTSLMTYWYPGVIEAISIVREKHPHTPVILGGLYARLCPEHAGKFSGADHISTSTALPDMKSIIKIFEALHIAIPEHQANAGTRFHPAFDLMKKLDYVCIQTSIGCPYHCRYCASNYLYPAFSRRDPLEVVEELRHWNHEHGISDFAFYDDALLVDPERHAMPIMEGVIKQGLNIRFHTPNALHIREISRDMARLLHDSGFRTIRLGLETSEKDRQDNLDMKVSEGEFEKAVQHLINAGFNKKDVGAYILAGLPGQSVKSVENSIRFVHDAGAIPYLAEFSPLPHTPLWEKALEHSSYNLADEPLFHNNSILPCWDEDKRQQFPGLTHMIREIRQG
jgi:radical SAM superfamily enzyme YgiQ (UPF0313 family)